jgi:hypothetical protein
LSPRFESLNYVSRRGPSRTQDSRKWGLKHAARQLIRLSHWSILFIS